MTNAMLLQWATVLGLGALIKSLIDILASGIKEAREARRAPLHEAELIRRSRLIWQDYASVCKAIALRNGVDPNLIPPIPDDPMIKD